MACFTLYEVFSGMLKWNALTLLTLIYIFKKFADPQNPVSVLLCYTRHIRYNFVFSGHMHTIIQWNVYRSCLFRLCMFSTFMGAYRLLFRYKLTAYSFFANTAIPQHRIDYRETNSCFIKASYILLTISKHWCHFYILITLCCRHIKVRWGTCSSGHALGITIHVKHVEGWKYRLHCNHVLFLCFI